MKSFKQFISEDSVDDADKRAQKKGFEPLTDHQKHLLRSGMFKKEAPAALVAARTTQGRGRFVGSAAVPKADLSNLPAPRTAGRKAKEQPSLTKKVVVGVLRALIRRSR